MDRVYNNEDDMYEDAVSRYYGIDDYEEISHQNRIDVYEEILRLLAIDDFDEDAYLQTYVKEFIDEVKILMDTNYDPMTIIDRIDEILITMHEDGIPEENNIWFYEIHNLLNIEFKHKDYFKNFIEEELIIKTMHPSRMMKNMMMFDDIEGFFNNI